MSPLKIPVRLTTSRKEDGEGKTLGHWISIAVSSFLCLILVKWIWPSSTPFDTFQFFRENEIAEGVKAAGPIFLWGAVITSLFAFTTLNKKSLNHKAEHILIGGIITSTIAGVVEELVFRWIIFLWGIIGVQVANFLFFGWLGFGIAEWLHMNLFGPVVNFFTVGKMQWLIYDMGWVVGAAALAANAKFRSGHAYLGWFGLINSWIIGFFLFWIMFSYGLWAAIIVHFLYDLFIFVIRYVDAAIERHFRWGHPG